MWCLAVSMLWCSIFVADLIVGMEELELYTDAEADLGKSKWGRSNGGLRPLSATIVHFCGHFGPLSKRNFRRKMATLVGNHGQLWRCKTGFGWCKRLLGDLCSLAPKHLLHPLLTSKEKLYTPPPLPPFPAKHFSGELGYATGILYAPTFYTPPTPRRVFSPGVLRSKDFFRPYFRSVS